MFSDLLRRLGASAPGPLPDPDARTALAALLVRIARTDGDYAEAERSRIDRLLAAHHGLSPFEAAQLRADAEVLEAEAPDTVRFTRALKAAVALDDRTALLDSLWEVALADGRRDNEEGQTMRLITRLLGLTDVASGLARQRVEARLRASGQS